MSLKLPYNELSDSHTPEAIRIRLAQETRHSYLRDFVFGAVDGLVTTFAVVSGAAGASLSSRIVIILGVANLIGDGFSMAAGNFLATQADRDLVKKARDIEASHIKKVPEGEKEEIRQIFARKGFKGHALESAVTIITSDPKLWIDTMLKEELGLPLEGEDDRADMDAVSTVKQAKAVFEEGTKNRDRLLSLSRSGIASDSELDTTEATYRVALARYDTAVEEARSRLAALAQRRAEHEIARKQLADASVRAPFDSAVQARPGSVGEYVAPGTPIVKLVKTDPLRLRLEVPERESVQVRVGQLVSLLVEGDTNVFTGTIARLSPAIDEQSRMLLVEADVPSRGSLRPGLFARARIVVNEQEQVVSVPTNAVVTFAGLEKVILVRNGQALEKLVTTGRRELGSVEIIAGLSADETVVLDPGNLHTGQAVAVTESTGSRTPMESAKAGGQ